MTKKPNQIDFIEFPAKTPSAVADAKTFYSETFGLAFQDWGDDYADTSSSGIGTGFTQTQSTAPAGLSL